MAKSRFKSLRYYEAGLESYVNMDYVSAVKYFHEALDAEYFASVFPDPMDPSSPAPCESSLFYDIKLKLAQSHKELAKLYVNENKLLAIFYYKQALKYCENQDHDALEIEAAEIQQLKQIAEKRLKIDDKIVSKKYIIQELNKQIQALKLITQSLNQTTKNNKKVTQNLVEAIKIEDKLTSNLYMKVTSDLESIDSSLRCEIAFQKKFKIH